MKDKRFASTGVQDLCRRLKEQLDELNLELSAKPTLPDEEVVRRTLLMEQLKAQLAELSR